MQVITGKDDQALPDDRIIQRVIEAANGANPDAIHRLLLQVANGQKRREIGSYGYFLKVVGEKFQKR